MKRITTSLLLIAGLCFALPGFSQIHKIQVTSNQPPPLNISGLADLDIVEGNSVALGDDASISGGYGSYMYTWAPSEHLDADTILNPNASPQTTTNFMLTVTDQYGCTETAELTVTVSPTGIINTKGGSAIDVFPNPSTGDITIRIQSPEGIDKITYSIHNSAGSQVFTKESFTASETLDLSGLSPGTYTLTISSESFSIKRHIVLSR